MKRDKTVADVAGIFDVDPNTVRKWAREGCGHGNKKGHPIFDEAEVAAWLKAQGLTGRVGRPTPPMNLELLRAKIRKETALAGKYELELSQQQGMLIDAGEVSALMEERQLALRAAMQGACSRLALKLEGVGNAAQAEGIIEAELKLVYAAFLDRRDPYPNPKAVVVPTPPVDAEPPK
jgi:transposase-like protein